MPNENQKGFAPIILLLSLVAMLGIGGSVYYFTKYQQSPLPTPSQSPISSKSKVTYTPTTAKKGINLDTSTWKTYKDHYGEYIVKYPGEWQQERCGGERAPDGCNDFGIFDQSGRTKRLISISAGSDAIDLPSLSTKFKRFENRNIIYSIYSDPDNAAKHGYPIELINNILDKMADSITYLNEPGTCQDPALVPLNDFPNNFTLSNFHDSDSKDPVVAVSPFTKPIDEDKKNRISQSWKENSERVFLVKYAKSGDPFVADQKFQNSVTPIYGREDKKDSYAANLTGMLHINCVDTEEDRLGHSIPYHLSSNDKDSFAIQAYGYSGNSSLLWGVKKWNLDLLKQRRNEVYIKMGNRWQKYVATGYFTAIPGGYGGKPAIYLYPTKDTKVQVEIKPNGQLIKTDDLYNPGILGWNIEVSQNGRINNSVDYLYYEAIIPVKKPKRGYVVSYDNLFDFSKKYVVDLGLNETEANEFIQFWKEKLPYSPYYFVSHLELQTINQIYPFKISPTPDTLMRVEIYFQPLENFEQVEPPALPEKIERKGFTAVEWGGILDKK